uniref:Uncharacterized protein n=1 Tax=Panagrolaimus sp. JU765 TaxID=591449 RepID=A0AC34RB24_9BILA
MPEKQTKNTVIRSKKVRFLRYVLRRKQCSYILCAEIGLTVAFLLLSTSFFIWKEDMRKSRLTKEREDVAIEKYRDRTTFAHCTYQKSETFSTDFCQDRAGPIAFAYRYWKLESTIKTPPSCIDLNEQVMCHDDLVQKRNKTSATRKHLNLFMPPKNSVFCYGRSLPSSAKNTKYEPAKDGKGGERHVILTDLTNFINMTLHASELHYRCPVCSPEKKECIRRIFTADSGWPWFLKRCNDVEKSGDDCKNSTGKKV